jgi:voltage-gated potassium channel Kch
MLILGDLDPLVVGLVNRLADSGGAGHAHSPASDAEARALLLQAEWTSVAIVTRDDARALRLTLLCAHLRPELPLWVTLFDRTVVHRLHSIVPGVRILSPADLAATTLLAPCLAAGAGPAPWWRRGVRLVDDALRLLTGAGIGLIAILLIEIVMSIVALHEGVVDALFSSARVIATITDARAAARGPDWFKLVDTAMVLVAVGLVSVFTAALVRRLSGPRLTALLGRRSAPRRRHVVLAGLGQVGFRLAQRLIEHGVPVLAIERDLSAPCVRMARRAGIPVVIADAEDRETLELAGVARSAVVAAVTSDDLANVAIGLTASELAPRVPLVLRLGDGDVASETESLLHLGLICDIHNVIADEIASHLLADAGRPGDGTLSYRS